MSINFQRLENNLPTVSCPILPINKREIRLTCYSVVQKILARALIELLDNDLIEKTIRLRPKGSEKMKQPLETISVL